MARTYFYYQGLRKTIIQFLDTLNDIQVARYDKRGNFWKYIEVPLKFAPKERAFYYIKEFKEDKILPVISANIENIEYAETRQGARWHTITKNTSAGSGTVQTFLNPVPYDIHFNVAVWTKYMSDLDQILEQILPYFSPNITIKVPIPEVDTTFDVNIIFNGGTPEFQFEYPDEDHRIIRFNLMFVAQTWLFKPVESVGLVEKIIMNYYLKKSGFDTSQSPGGLASTFTSGASGESQRFSSHQISGSYFADDGDPYIKYEIFQFGDEVGTDEILNDL